MLPITPSTYSFLSLDVSFSLSEFIDKWFSWLAVLFSEALANSNISSYSFLLILKVSETVSANSSSVSVWSSSANINSRILIRTITFCLCSSSSFIWVQILSTLTELTEVLFFLLSFFRVVPWRSLIKSSNILRYLSTNSEVKSCFKKAQLYF